MKTKLTLILLAHNEEKTILNDIVNIHQVILKKIKNVGNATCLEIERITKKQNIKIEKDVNFEKLYNEKKKI